MTTKEITQLLNIPHSTLSDWESSDKRKKLAKLLRALAHEDVMEIINAKEDKTKYSEQTRKIRLNKKLFTKDLLWSRQDGSQIEVRNLIAIYLNTPNQEDTHTLLKLFGYERVFSVLQNHRSAMPEEDYRESLEQIEYAKEPETYFNNHPLPVLEQVLMRPKKRYIDALVKRYDASEIVNMAKEYGASFPSIFQIKKMTGLSV